MWHASIWNVAGPVVFVFIIGWHLVHTVFGEPGVSSGRQALWAAVLLLGPLSVLRMAFVSVVIADEVTVRNFLTTRRFAPGEILDVAEDWPWNIATIWTTQREKPFPVSGLLAADASTMRPPRWWTRKSTEIADAIADWAGLPAESEGLTP